MKVVCARAFSRALRVRCVTCIVLAIQMLFVHSYYSSLKLYRYAQYSSFKIHSEADYYKLEIDGYEGNAGNALSDLDYGSNNIPFSTYNRDNDRSSLNCASMLKVR